MSERMGHTRAVHWFRADVDRYAPEPGARPILATACRRFALMSVEHSRDPARVTCGRCVRKMSPVLREQVGK